MKLLMKYSLVFILSIFLIKSLSAQNYSNKYIEIERRDDKKSFSFTDTIVLIYMSDDNIIWQRKGGVGYKGMLKDNKTTLDFNFTQFSFSKNELTQIIELKSGNRIHILQRVKAFDNTQINHLNINIPDVNKMQEVDLQFLYKKKWKLMRILDENGKIYPSEAPVDFYSVKSYEETIAFYTIDDIKEPSYRLKEIEQGYIFHIEDKNGQRHEYYFYYISDEAWFLSDIQRNIFYYFVMEYR